MPELPEVETLKCFLEKHIVGHKIISFVKRRNSLRSKLDPNLSKKTTNSVINGVRRVAKYLIIELDNNNSIVFHLGMTGRVTLKKDTYVFQKHDHVAFVLAGGNLLVFNDSRRFGMLYVSATNLLKSQQYLQNLGPEPFSEQFNVDYLEKCFRNRKIPIKTAIMDNKIVVGVGNIYASESLFLSKINPLKQVHTLTKIEISSLIQSIVFVLNEAIKAGGTTLRDFVNGDNKPGYFKQQLKVYGRKNESCYSCREKIAKFTQAGRATYFCPNCQK